MAVLSLKEKRSTKDPNDCNACQGRGYHADYSHGMCSTPCANCGGTGDRLPECTPTREELVDA